MHHADVVLNIGARFDDRVTGKVSDFCPHARKIHVDIDASSINKIVKVDVPSSATARMCSMHCRTRALVRGGDGQRQLTRSPSMCGWMFTSIQQPHRTATHRPTRKSPLPGRSTLMTRAPRSASWRVQSGAVIACSSETNRNSVERS